jgi:hypothetical protein
MLPKGHFIPIEGFGQPVAGFCTTREGGVSFEPYQSLNLGLHVGDNPEAVHANRACLNRDLPQPPVWLNQVHGTQVFNADRYDPSHAPQTVPTADAAVTTRIDLPLAILTADCLPIVMADQSGTVLGVAHAGWRGLAQGVLEATLQAMQQASPHMRGYSAWIGPGIGPLAFQVGQEVYQTFVEQHADDHVFFKPDVHQPDKWLADLAGLAEQRLFRLGAQKIVQSQRCTVQEDKYFFSYRREGQTGRMATVAWLTRCDGTTII